ncbi:cytochrome-c oxidase, cbb3-type subunit III [Panacagrimonas perspica]|uniref:cytochrome-c oxidase, cbb3-type subunit III n=1 Tax=Panacagrimonas perspica TaxID=381431 RepID=UPI001FE54CDC|nr:cytochrome-c oxidase, cbb3-type subunit III [Panacagrimonas perspica]
MASIVGCVWLLLANRKGKSGDTTGHVWDDDLSEYNNPLPRWWFNLFVLTVVFAVGYLAFYPGLGNLAGRLGWTSTQEMEEGLAKLTEQRTAQYARYVSYSVDQLAQDAGARSMGRAVFLSNCAGCHGPDARGAIGFPDLTDQDWLYGGDAETLLATIKSGRTSKMPAFNGALSPEQLQALVNFVPFWSDKELDPHAREVGMAAFAGMCAACHGAEGKGNVTLGAPNLTDDVWLFGGSQERVRNSILWGRESHMPAHDTLISPDEQRLVAGYIKSLSEKQSGAEVLQTPPAPPSQQRTAALP